MLDNQAKEIYVDSTSGEIFTEVLVDTLKNQIESNITESVEYQSESISKELTSKDDGWFSGLFPSYMKTKSPFKNKENKTVVKSNEPILVEKSTPRKKLGFWGKLFPKPDSRNLVEDSSDKVEAQKTETEITNLVKLQNEYVPSKIENRGMKLTDDNYNILSQTQLSDTNNVVIKTTLRQNKNRF